jgi:hypothetical protein
MGNQNQYRRQKQRRLGIEAVEQRLLLSADLQLDQRLLDSLPTGETSLVAAATPTTAQTNRLPPDVVASGLIVIMDDVSAMAGGATALEVNGPGGTHSTTHTTSGSGRPLTGPAQPAGVAAYAETGQNAGQQDTSSSAPAGPVLLRIAEADLLPSPSPAGLIDTTPRADETMALAIAQAASHQELLARPSNPSQVDPAIQSLRESPPQGDGGTTVDGPLRAAKDQLNGTRGRSQAFDLAGQQPAARSTTDKADDRPLPLLVAAEPAKPAVPGNLPTLPTAGPRNVSPTTESDSRSDVSSEMDGSRAGRTAIRIDTDHRSRGTIPLLILSALVPELMHRLEGPEEETTELFPPKPRRRTEED